jgi:acetoin utilization deacetylase AcuC-like enzyme
LIVISAGFDSARGDPLGQLDVTPGTYAYIVKKLKEVQQKMVVALEGGYNKLALGLGVEAVVRVLLD